MFVFSIQTIVEVIVVTLLVIWFVTIEAKKYFKQKRCKHVKYHETGSCDAVCTSCGKNLGFIGAVRDKRKHESVERATDNKTGKLI